MNPRFAWTPIFTAATACLTAGAAMALVISPTTAGQAQTTQGSVECWQNGVQILSRSAGTTLRPPNGALKIDLGDAELMLFVVGDAVCAVTRGRQ